MSDALFGWIFLPRSSRSRIVVFRSLNIFLSYCHSHSIKFAMEMTQGSKMENNFRMHELDTTELLPLRKMLSFVGHESIARESLSILRVCKFLFLSARLLEDFFFWISSCTFWPWEHIVRVRTEFLSKWEGLFHCTTISLLIYWILSWCEV